MESPPEVTTPKIIEDTHVMVLSEGRAKLLEVVGGLSAFPMDQIFN